MTSNTKSVVLLAFTLIVGFSLGLFADASLVRGRRERIDRMRRPPGLVEHLQEVIQPRDSAQADSIRSVLQRIATGNEQIIRDANERLRAHMDSLRTVLDPMLDANQRSRLTAELQRLPPMGRGRGRGFGPPAGPGGGPPDGRGFPPSREGGPPPD